MIHYILQGHELQNDVQTMIQVFYPNLHYIRMDEVVPSGLSVISSMEKGIASAVLCRDGKKVNRFSMEYQEGLGEKEEKRLIKRTIYELLKAETGLRPQWGLLTGVRPAKIISGLLMEGNSEDDCLEYLTKDYLVMEHKAKLALTVAKAEEKILNSNKPKDISLYIGIPFCPTRCLYCSFTAYPLAQYKNRVDEYLEAMFRELEFLEEYAKDLHVQNIYIGGGTPTSLTEQQLQRLLQKVAILFDTKDIEYTVEAGRPDTITKEKLRLMKDYGVNRISINPQTMNEDTLKRIGRQHSVEDIRRVFYEARELGHENINMDLILGLPGEEPEDVRSTMEEILALAPDNVTVHTLAVKRASRLKEEFDQHTLATAEALEKMLSIAAEYAEKMGMEPYYMYRQKNMVGNFENVGYCHPGKEGIYNVQIMEEKQTVLAVGAGASTKTVDPQTDRIERIFNVKSVEDYIARIDEMIERKKVGLPKGGWK
ncbi:coproporphyrinogen dehydrogenase HemZ [Anaerotignum sp. MB30-C6]|uniref:coproporphyrinogen dehydrogenase HemZ n=1 Tax=Anaerotignum sp. MB30-C6 TaxID=3070814 RepID=UPI0027DBDD16|nr:coproporphyrinogen dehydrogenase HemZ [Anaerotignum sp. MB30-C6]WMI80700.1 coproporphyrinogen dehydrogenase HemZ [Anaerotignum sp. MB30-C6]